MPPLSPHYFDSDGIPLWKKVRQELFPALGAGVYLKSAESAPIPKPVFDAYYEFAKKLYETGDLYELENLAVMDEVRALFKELLHVPEADDIAFGPNTSHNMGLLAHHFNDPQKKTSGSN